MVCRFEHRRFINPVNGYTVADYSTKDLEQIPGETVLSDASVEVTFTAFGQELPCIDEIEIELDGNWKKSEKYG